MANRVIRNRSFPQRSQRRLTAWVGGVNEVTGLAFAPGAVVIASLNAAALAIRPWTIVRVRGGVFVISDQQAASELQFGAFGASVVSDQASAIGVTAVPTPITDDGSDLFFVYQSFVSSLVFGDATGITNEGQWYPIDSKAMRKVNDDQNVVITAELDASSSGVTLITAFRMLIKLH